MNDDKVELHRKYWDILNNEARMAILGHEPLA